MDLILIAAIAILNLFVAFFGASVGGSGLVMTPVLMSLGVPAPSAVAAKRFSNLGLSSFSLVKFQREGKVIWRIGLPLVAVAMTAAYITANIVLTIDETVLQRIIGAVILGVLGFMILNKKFGLEEKARRMRKRHKVLGAVFYFLAVMTANFSGGGGILTSYVLIFFFGLTFIYAAGTRKVAGIMSTITSVLVYIAAGVIPYEIAVPMLATGAVGGWTGSHYAIKKGDAWVRRVFMVVITILGIRLLLF
jgi:uncharacterized membrane protein YfcA